MRSRRLSYWVPESDLAPVLAQWINDPEVRRHLDHRVFPVSVEAEKTWISGLTERMNARTDVTFVFGFAGDTSPIGVVSLHLIRWIARSTELGILIAKDHWGQGYGTEVTRRIVEYAFRDLGLNSVRLRVNADHLSAIKAYERAGFMREGVMRQAVFREGAFVDVVIMSVLRSDWTASGSDS